MTMQRGWDFILGTSVVLLLVSTGDPGAGVSEV
jgi:hypothetical protein